MVAKNEVTIPGAYRFDLTGPSGEYRIFVYVPQAPAPAGGHPVIYALDGNAHFISLVASVKAHGVRPDLTGLDPAVVVGIGYPIDADHDLDRRTLDYTPAADRLSLGERPDKLAWGTIGGAEAFGDFIEASIKPLILADHPVNPARQSLFGHSFGGLFALHMALTRPQLYRRFLISSPSIWFADRYILSLVEGLETRLRAIGGGCRMMLSVGALEEYVPPQLDEAVPDYAQWIRRNAMIANLRVLKERLERLAGIPRELLDITYHEIEGEHHGSVPPVAINRAMPVALKA